MMFVKKEICQNCRWYYGHSYTTKMCNYLIDNGERRVKMPYGQCGSFQTKKTKRNKMFSIKKGVK